MSYLSYLYISLCLSACLFVCVSLCISLRSSYVIHALCTSILVYMDLVVTAQLRHALDGPSHVSIAFRPILSSVSKKIENGANVGII